MEETKINFETAKLAQAKGYNWGCMEVFDITNTTPKPYTRGWSTKCTNSDYNLESDKHISAPTQSLLQKWLREIHGIYVNSDHDLNPKGDGILYHTNWGFINAPTEGPSKDWYRVGGGYSENEEFKTYEEALEIGLQEALKLIE